MKPLYKTPYDLGYPTALQRYEHDIKEVNKEAEAFNSLRVFGEYDGLDLNLIGIGEKNE